MNFPTVRLEGGLLSAEILEQVAQGEAPGQTPGHFGLDEGVRLTDEIHRAWSDARHFWGTFNRLLARLPEDDPATSDTRERWIIPLLRVLGYDLSYKSRAAVVEGQTFAISHRAGKGEDAPPIHIVGCRQPLDRRSPTGRPRLSPHALVQEYLNRTEHLWGLVTNGYQLRLLRESLRTARPTYVEFDLQQMMEGEHLPDFALLFRLLHRSRLPRGVEDAKDCLLERYHLISEEQGGRIRYRLRLSVKKALVVLGNGFLRHPKNEALRRALREGQLSSQDLYRELLYLIYRLLFLLVVEERQLLTPNPVYRKHYSISRLRHLAEARPQTPGRHGDLWLGLRTTFKLLARENLGRELDLPPLDGELFSSLKTEHLGSARLANSDLLTALWHLCLYRDEEASSLRRVNYAALNVEELGSVYESLLDFHPVVREEGGRLLFELVPGQERKSTGSYYTRPELVQELVKSALEPVLEERLSQASTSEEKERAILLIKVCDPASGSGHFILAAARRLGKELARVRTGEPEPSPEAFREAVRDVIGHCIYGVDLNPLAVDLCKVALWIESHTSGRPLTFLDHRIKCGNSLIGVFDLSVLEEGIPDDAYKPAAGDHKETAKALKKQNRDERKAWKVGQYHLFEEDLRELGRKFAALEEFGDSSPEEIRQKEKLYLELMRDPRFQHDRTACNLWTAAFFSELIPGNAGKVPTSEALRRYLEGKPINPRIIAHAEALAEKHRFFHWPLEFPDVFAQGGFDVVLSNPPWERIKLQEKEFFDTRDRGIADAPNAAARKRLIQKLPETNPALWREYQEALHTAESVSRFLRSSGQYPLTGRGDINTYSVFAERIRRLLKPEGRAGIIVPTGIATDNTNKHFFADLVEKGALVSLFDFENREKIFPAVDSRYKFCLLTLQGAPERPRAGATPLTFAFFATRAEHLRDHRRVFYLSPKDIARINPNTRTLPVFRTRQDAELTRAIYEHVPVLVNERADENPWSVRFLAMFHMANDSHLFRTREQLEEEGFQLVGNRFVKDGEVYLPLYEAKMIWHYDHRFGTYESVTSRSSTHLATPDTAQHADPGFLIQPWYWVPAEEVNARLGDWKRGWLLGFRRITNATNERTAIFTMLPRVGAGDVLPVVLGPSALESSLLLACFLAIALDFAARQKIGGVHLDFHYAKQLPVLPPDTYTPEDLRFIVPRVLELVYTAWDIKPFADDVWREADETLRAAIRAQWEENAAQTGGHTWNLLDWITAYLEIETDPKKGIPLPPFKWDEERRARLRAELDAYYARLYGLSRKQLRYILDPADLTERELEDILDPWEEVRDPLDPEAYAERVRKSTFPGETFRVLKEKELRLFGDYRTRRQVLEAWERMESKHAC